MEDGENKIAGPPPARQFEVKIANGLYQSPTSVVDRGQPNNPQPFVPLEIVPHKVQSITILRHSTMYLSLYVKLTLFVLKKS